MDLKLIHIRPSTWLGCLLLPYKVFSKQENILENLWSVFHMVGACSNLVRVLVMDNELMRCCCTQYKHHQIIVIIWIFYWHDIYVALDPFKILWNRLFIKCPLTTLHFGWMSMVLMKHCQTIDESNVRLQWVSTPRLVMCMLYPCDFYCWGQRKH